MSCSWISSPCCQGAGHLAAAAAPAPRQQHLDHWLQHSATIPPISITGVIAKVCKSRTPGLDRGLAPRSLGAQGQQVTPPMQQLRLQTLGCPQRAVAS